MFRTCAHPLALHAIHVGCSNLASQQGVFAVVFEVAAAKRMTHDVHAWSEQYVAAIFQRFVSDGSTYLLYKFGVPSGSEHGSYGESCAVIGLGVSFTGRVDAHSCGPIGQHRGRDAKTWDGTSCTGSSGHRCLTLANHVDLLVGRFASQHTLKRFEHTSVHSDEQLGFLFDGHGLEYFLYVVGGEFQFLCMSVQGKKTENR